MDSVTGKTVAMAKATVSEEGNKISPDAFCPTYKEFMCYKCARVHRDMKLTKSRALLDKSSMPSSFHGEESEEENYIEICQRHGKEFIKYLCPNHDELLCGDCVVEKMHRSCDIDKISQVAKRYKEGAEYNNLKTGLDQMVRDIGEVSNNIMASTKPVNEDDLTNINELRKFRNQLNQYLDKRERELL